MKKTKAKKKSTTKKIVLHFEITKNKALIKRNAIKLGLHKLNFSKYYKLIKTGSTLESNIIPGFTGRTVISHGKPYVLGDEEVVWLFFSERGMSGGWFRTSPIVEFKKTKNGFKFETENSFYEVIPC